MVIRPTPVRNVGSYFLSEMFVAGTSQSVGRSSGVGLVEVFFGQGMLSISMHRGRIIPCPMVLNQW